MNSEELLKEALETSDQAAAQLKSLMDRREGLASEILYEATETKRYTSEVLAQIIIAAEARAARIKDSLDQGSS